MERTKYRKRYQVVLGGKLRKEYLFFEKSFNSVGVVLSLPLDVVRGLSHTYYANNQHKIPS
jgi:hypothetical protein